MRQQVAALTFALDSGETVSCTISAGLADVTAEMKSLDDLLKAADDALYEAKGTGRNRSVFRGHGPRPPA